MQPFSTVVLENGTVLQTLVGTLDDSNFEALKQQVEDAKRVVREASEAAGKPVDILFDLTTFTGTYNVGAMLAMKDLEKANRPYVRKVAVFGGPMAARIAAEITLALIGRENLNLFQGRAEAEAWLKGA